MRHHCRELQPYDEPACRAATYDFSGQYLAVGGSDLRVYAPKQVRAGWLTDGADL